jgi:hypothetical protein
MPTGPPDKWAAFSTLGMTSPTDLANALTTLSAEGYLGPVVAVPAPVGPTASWVAVGGYTTA